MRVTPLEASFVIVALALSSSSAKPIEPTISKEAVSKSIATFRQQPLSEEGHAAGATILHFAEDSGDVQVVISPAGFPWSNIKRQYKHGEVLLVAYVAGSIRSQLERHITKNDPVAAAEQVIETYQQIKQREPGYRVPEIEKIVSLKASGKLKENVEAHDK